ncbi:MAG: 16S rRNA methyltransferase [Theionarchaea archaeon]|nr:16S rRNA methyltransferase [Theionarchaea archaeon]
MLTLVIAEAELELIPPSLYHHPVIRRSAQKRKKSPQHILLDSNFHHKALNNLPEGYRRGRPDIIHVTLLCMLESILNKEGHLTCYIHTRNDEIISIDAKTRIPRSYNRFCGLMEQVLREGAINELLHIEYMSLSALLETLPGKKVLMHRKGEYLELSPHMVCIIGGFPHGDFHAQLPYPSCTLSSHSLSAWTVATELTVRYELL